MTKSRHDSVEFEKVRTSGDSEAYRCRKTRIVIFEAAIDGDYRCVKDIIEISTVWFNQLKKQGLIDQVIEANDIRPIKHLFKEA